jgi:hypothetical protein
LYALMAIWLLALTTVMVVRLGQPASAQVLHRGRTITEP